MILAKNTMVILALPTAFLFFGALGLLPEARAGSSNLGFSVTSDASLSHPRIEVRDARSRQPLDDAAVTLTEAPRGLFSVTVSKPGYVTLTLAGVRPARVEIELEPLATSAPQVLAQGNVSGWVPPRLSRRNPLGKPVSIGLVLRALQPTDLLGFGVGSMLSPLRDTIDILGPRSIPSNLVLPQQSIPIGIGRIRVKKTSYRLLLEPEVRTLLAATQGAIDSGDLLSLGNAKQIPASVLNKIRFTRLGFSAPFTPEGNTSLELEGNQELVPAHRVNASRPPFPADVVVTALTDPDGSGELLVPTDVKAPITLDGTTANPIALRSAPGATARDRRVLTTALSANQRRLSGIISAEAGEDVRPGDFLEVTELPDSAGLPASLPLAASEGRIRSVIFEGVTVTQLGRESAERSYPLWTVYVLPAAGETQLVPDSALLGAPVRSYSLLELEFGSALDESRIEAGTLIQGLRRFTRATAEIKASAH
ncbi:MAG: hypothetical protein NDJ89_16160 [Oligoflexia bacterium]|nr:hypothetical protein [Oligoflexia bacterium]